MAYLSVSIYSFPDMYQVSGILGYLVGTFLLYALAKRVGEAPAWLAFVPIFNLCLLARIGKFPAIIGLIFLIPVLGWLYLALTLWSIAERRGKPGLLGLCMLIPGLNLFVEVRLV